MKNSIYFMFGLCVTFFLSTNTLFGKGDKNAPDNSEKPITEPLVIPESVKKADVTVNMEMINSFRRCYDHIEVIPWGELARNTDPRDWGVAYMAYKRLSFKTPADSVTLMASLTAEMTKVQETIEANPDSISIVHITKAKQTIGPGKIIIVKKDEIANN